MIARLAGVAVDARALRRTTDSRDTTRSIRWIAANALAASGVRAADEVRAHALTELLAMLAIDPDRVDMRHVPHRWRLALWLLGVPAWR